MLHVVHLSVCLVVSLSLSGELGACHVLSGLAACGRLGVAARPACLFGTRPVARDQRHASHVGATPAD